MITFHKSIRGEKIFVKMMGHGKPLVFLHGGPGGEHRFFLPHVEALAENFSLIFYDQRGCGQSDPSVTNTYTIDEEIETLEELRVQLGMHKLSLVGESWGSMLALLYAVRYPEHVDKLFLTAAVGASMEGFTVFYREFEGRLSEGDREAIRQLEEQLKEGKGSADEIFRIINPYYVHSLATLERKTATTSNHEVNKLMGEEIMKNYDLRDELGKIAHIPIMVAQGCSDILTPALIEDLLMKYIPHGKLVGIEECGHWTVVEQPEKMCELIVSFFADKQDA